MPVTRSMPASRLTVPWRLYSCSRAKVACTPGSGGRSGAVVSMALDARFLAVGDDRHFGWLLLRCRCRLFQDFHLAIDARHVSHLFRKVGIALFQVVSHFVRFHVFLIEDLAHRALCQMGEARVSLCRSMFAGVAGRKPRRRQFVGITKVLRLPSCRRHQPRLGFQRDRRLPTRARTIVEGSHRAFNHRALDAALDGLMMQSERPADRKKRRIFPIGQQYPRAFHPARPVPSAIARSISNLAASSSSSANSIARRHVCHDFPLQTRHTRPI